MEEMFLALYSFQKDSECESKDGDDNEGSLDWVTLVDRGGLFHCRAEFQQFLHAMELVIKNEMKPGREVVMKIGFKDRMHAMVQQDEDVLFWWSVLCTVAEVDSDTESALLPLLINHYVTIRGFAFAARWVGVQTNHKEEPPKGEEPLEQTPMHCTGD